MTQIRIGFVGDSITHGTGDETLLGWTYRVGQAEAAKGHDVTVYNLGIRADLKRRTLDYGEITEVDGAIITIYRCSGMGPNQSFRIAMTLASDN